MIITRDEMTAHIDAGRAEQWTQPLDGMVPIAAKMDDTWYVILEGSDRYTPAPDPLPAILTRAHILLTTAVKKATTT